MTLTNNELMAWQAYQVGKPCPKHPYKTLKSGDYGNWCGAKDSFGWCNGGNFPTAEWLEDYRSKEHI